MQRDDDTSSEEETPERGFISFHYERKNVRTLNVADLINRIHDLRQRSLQADAELSTSAPPANVDYGSNSVDYMSLISTEDMPSTSSMQSTSMPSTSAMASLLGTSTESSTSRAYTNDFDPSQGKNWSTAVSPGSSRGSSPQQLDSPGEHMALNQLPAGCARGPPSSPKCGLYEQLSIEIPATSLDEGSSQSNWPPLLTPGGISPSRYEWPPMPSRDGPSTSRNEWPPSPNPPKGSPKFPRHPFGLGGIDPPSQDQSGLKDDEKEPKKSDNPEEGGQKQEAGNSDTNKDKPSRKGKGGPGKIKNRRKATEQ